MAGYRKPQVSSYLNYFPKIGSKHNPTHQGVTPRRDDLGTWLNELERLDVTRLLQAAAILTKAGACQTQLLFVKVKSWPSQFNSVFPEFQPI